MRNSCEYEVLTLDDIFERNKDLTPEDVQRIFKENGFKPIGEVKDENDYKEVLSSDDLSWDINTNMELKTEEDVQRFMEVNGLTWLRGRVESKKD